MKVGLKQFSCHIPLLCNTKASYERFFLQENIKQTVNRQSTVQGNVVIIKWLRNIYTSNQKASCFNPEFLELCQFSLICYHIQYGKVFFEKLNTPRAKIYRHWSQRIPSEMVYPDLINMKFTFDIPTCAHRASDNFSLDFSGYCFTKHIDTHIGRWKNG